MSEDTTGTEGGTPEDGQNTGTDGGNGTATADLSSLKAALDKERNLRREAEKRAKEGAGYKSKLDELAAAQMSEQEKAVAKATAEAEARGKAAATAAAAGRLARAEFRAAAAGLVDKDALDGFLEFADLSKFVAEDGEPDTKAIESVIKKLAGPQRPPSFDGGARTSTDKSTDMNRLIRQKAGFSG